MNQQIGDEVSRVLFEHAQSTWTQQTPVQMMGNTFLSPRFRLLPKSIDEDWVMGMCVDGIGTKVAVAERLGIWNSLGCDLLAMVCDDAIAMGAYPYMVSTTIDVGVYPKKEILLTHLSSLYNGLKAAAELVKVPVITGEFAQLGDRIRGNGPQLQLIWNAALTWIAPRSALINGTTVKPGDSIIALPERGPRSNGFTLLQSLLTNKYGDHWVDVSSLIGQTLGELALVPSTIYTPSVQRIFDARDAVGQRLCKISGMVHITGGGIPGKLQKYLSRSGHSALISNPLLPGPLFCHMLREGLIDAKTAYEHWNMGHGFLIITPDPDPILKILRPCFVEPEIQVIGHIVEATTVQSTVDMYMQTHLQW